MTVTVNVQVAVFPDESVAVYVTVVCPTLKVDPGCKPEVRRTCIFSPELSVALGTTQSTVTPVVTPSTSNGSNKLLGQDTNSGGMSSTAKVEYYCKYTMHQLRDAFAFL